MLIVSAFVANAQHNVVVYPSETYQYERFNGYYYEFKPLFERPIYTGEAQRLYMSFYNKGSDRHTLFVVIKDNNDGMVVAHDIISIDPMHYSERLEGIASFSYIGYSWDTSITVDYPTYYDFEAYWIYQGRF